MRHHLGHQQAGCRRNLQQRQSHSARATPGLTNFRAPVNGAGCLTLGVAPHVAVVNGGSKATGRPDGDEPTTGLTAVFAATVAARSAVVTAGSPAPIEGAARCT